MTTPRSESRQPVALVTGSARRVGRTIAEGLIADGWRVIVHARAQEAADEAAHELNDAARANAQKDEVALGGIGVDLGDDDAGAQVERHVARLLNETAGDEAARDDGQGDDEARGGALDLLVNSAASFESPPAWDQVDLASWHRSMDINARAPYLLIQALLPRLERAQGCVVNISDGAAHQHWVSHPIHAASKAALESLTLSGASALRKRGVRVNAIVPPTIMAPDSWSSERLQQEQQRGGVGDVAETVRLVVEFARDAARTGEIVVQNIVHE